MRQTALHRAHHSGIWHSTISSSHSLNLLLLCFPCCLMIPPLFLQPPADKSFSFIAQTQGLQVHRPQKGKKGGGSRGTRGGGGMGRSMVSWVITEEGAKPPLLWFNLNLSPLLPVQPRDTSRFCSAAWPHGREEQTASGAARRCHALLRVCVAGGRRGRAARPFLLSQQRSSNDCEVQLGLLRLCSGPSVSARSSQLPLLLFAEAAEH